MADSFITKRGNQMNNARKLSVIMLILGILLSGHLNQVHAQESIPITVGSDQSHPEGIWLDPETQYWVSSGETSRLAGNSLAASGGPDDYGYIWNSGVLTDWVDATDGIVLTEFHQPITLPFSFKYYEYTYSTVYIAKDGYITLMDDGMWPSQPLVPNPARPNPIIAPYATPIDPADSGTINRVYYKTVGTYPNRFIVVEWYQVTAGDENYTFEVILHENGDIVFQYQTMTHTSPFLCGTGAIEDSTGLWGLVYNAYCDFPPSNMTVRFNVPIQYPNIRVNPIYQGDFIGSGDTKTFGMLVSNTFGTSHLTINVTSDSVWPVTFKSPDTGQALTDTNGDGIIDTGPVSDFIYIIASIQAPPVLNVGSTNTSTITFVPVNYPERKKTVKIGLTVPAPFAQISTNDYDGALSLKLIQPGSVIEKQVTPEYYWPWEISLAEKQEGFIHSWNYPNDNDLDLKYELTDLSGDITRSITTLRNNTSADFEVYESSPAMAAAPDGQIGLTWFNQTFDPLAEETQENIYFAIQDNDGNIVLDPTNLTNNTLWGTPGDAETPFYSLPQIAATADNRFAITWQTELGEPSTYVSDIYFTILDSSGSVVKATSHITNDSPGYSSFYQEPAIARLSGNRVVITWFQRASYIEGAAFSVLDSSGNVLRANTGLGKAIHDLDVVQLGSGPILIAGTDFVGTKPKINYTFVSSTSYSQYPEFTEIINPYAFTGDGYVSVTSDQVGRGILTWMDYSPTYRVNLYYSMVQPYGTPTSPVMFETCHASSPNLYSSFSGSGNAPFALVTPTTSEFDLKITAEPDKVVLSGGSTEVHALIQNVGKQWADPVTLKATLDPALTYVGANPSPTTVIGNVITWSLPPLDFLGSGKITLNILVPVAAENTPYSISWETIETDINPDDNSATQQITIGPKVFLPLILR